MKRLLVLAALATGCGAPPPAATPADALRSHVELAELQQGRSIMVSKCGNCHRPPQPGDYAASMWPHKLDEMSDRANLQPRQRRLIEQYFIVMAQR